MFSFIGGLLGSGSQKKAVNKATQAQVDAFNKAIDLENQQYQQTRSDYLPYTQAGVGAIGNYGDLIGANGFDKEQSAINDLQASPFYQQSLKDANENLLQTAAATGGVRGGNTAGAVGQLAPDILAQYYQNAIGNYGNLAQLGLGATGSVANFGQQNANNVSGLYGNIGNAYASKYLTKGGINAANWANAGSFLDSIASAAVGGAAGGGGAGGALSGALKSIF